MSEAVIVDAIRTPVGRAIRGTLRDIRADDLAAIPLRALVERNPEIDFRETNDVMMGCGFPDHEQGYNVARNAVLLRGIRPPRPGGHGQPLLRIFAADDPHGVPRDQGRRRRPVHRGGRRMHVSRRGHDASGDEPAARRVKRHRLQRVHPDGDDGRERGRALQGQPRGPGRVGGAVSAARGRGARERPLRLARSWGWTYRRPTTPAATSSPQHTVTRDDGPRAGTTVETLSKLKPAFKPGGSVTAGQLMPAERRRRRRAGDVGGEGPRARPQAAGAHRGLRGGGDPPRDHGPRADPGGQGGAEAGGLEDRRHRLRGAQRGVRGAGAAVSRRAGHRSREAQHQRRRDRAGPSVRR